MLNLVRIILHIKIVMFGRNHTILKSSNDCDITVLSLFQQLFLFKRIQHFILSLKLCSFSVSPHYQGHYFNSLSLSHPDRSGIRVLNVAESKTINCYK